MKLPRLTQLVLLDRSMAGTVFTYLRAEQVAVLRRNLDEGKRMSTTEVLSLAPLERLLKRLAKLAARDQLPLRAPKPTKKPRKPKPPKPHQLKVDYAEMAVIRFYYGRMLASAGVLPGHQELLATALGRFHQPSVTLESHIQLAPPCTYSRQLDMF
jgi:hypothetical protein